MPGLIASQYYLAPSGLDRIAGVGIRGYDVAIHKTPAMD